MPLTPMDVKPGEEEGIKFVQLTFWPHVWGRVPAMGQRCHDTERQSHRQID